jgi:UDP-galactopyranose mutase
MAKNEKGVIFVGRLATYKYLDMWMAIKHVLIKLKNV